MDIQMVPFLNVFVNLALIAQLLSDKKKRSASIPWHSEVCDDLHASTKRDAPDGALYRVLTCSFQKVAISECHKAQTLSAGADSYVKKKALFFVNC